MYRIIFKPSLGKWIIQISTMMFFWKTICEMNSKKSIITFQKFEDAKKYVEERGLENIYTDYRTIPKYGFFSSTYEHEHKKEPQSFTMTDEVFNKFIDGLAEAIKKRMEVPNT